MQDYGVDNCIASHNRIRPKFPDIRQKSLTRPKCRKENVQDAGCIILLRELPTLVVRPVRLPSVIHFVWYFLYIYGILTTSRVATGRHHPRQRNAAVAV